MAEDDTHTVQIYQHISASKHMHTHWAHSYAHLAGSEEVKPRLSTFVLLIDQNVSMGNERSQGGKLNQRQTLTVTKCGDCVPLSAPHKALLREQLTAINYFKICELTWALRPIRFRAAGHQWIYHYCISQEHASGQGERGKKNINNI